MEQKRITQRLIHILEVEFNMRDALNIPTKNPEDIEIKFFADDIEHHLKITKRKGKR